VKDARSTTHVSDLSIKFGFFYSIIISVVLVQKRDSPKPTSFPLEASIFAKLPSDLSLSHINLLPCYVSYKNLAQEKRNYLLIRRDGE
jgi:hypothetical protein